MACTSLDGASTPGTANGKPPLQDANSQFLQPSARAVAERLAILKQVGLRNTFALLPCCLVPSLLSSHVHSSSEQGSRAKGAPQGQCGRGATASTHRRKRAARQRRQRWRCRGGNEGGALRELRNAAAASTRVFARTGRRWQHGPQRGSGGSICATGGVGREPEGAGALGVLIALQLGRRRGQQGASIGRFVGQPRAAAPLSVRVCSPCQSCADRRWWGLRRVCGGDITGNAEIRGWRWRGLARAGMVSEGDWVAVSCRG